MKEVMNNMLVCFRQEVFNHVMDQCIENYECLVINNNAKVIISDQVFGIKQMLMMILKFVILCSGNTMKITMVLIAMMKKNLI